MKDEKALGIYEFAFLDFQEYLPLLLAEDCLDGDFRMRRSATMQHDNCFFFFSEAKDTRHTGPVGHMRYLLEHYLYSVTC